MFRVPFSEFTSLLRGMVQIFQFFFPEDSFRELILFLQSFLISHGHFLIFLSESHFSNLRSKNVNENRKGCLEALKVLLIFSYFVLYFQLILIIFTWIFISFSFVRTPYFQFYISFIPFPSYFSIPGAILQI